MFKKQKTGQKNIKSSYLNIVECKFFYTKRYAELMKKQLFKYSRM